MRKHFLKPNSSAARGASAVGNCSTPHIVVIGYCMNGAILGWRWGESNPVRVRLRENAKAFSYAELERSERG